MNQLADLVNVNIGGWMCSGDDVKIQTKLFREILNKSVSQQFVQAVIISEDMVQTISKIVESDEKNKGYIPSNMNRYFPAFSGRNVDIKERMGEILERCQVDRNKVDEIMAYVNFIVDLESELGNSNGIIDETVLQKYLIASTVENTLNEAVANRTITPEKYGDWIADYSDCSNGRIYLKQILNRLIRCFALKSEHIKSIASLKNGERLCFVIKSDMRNDVKELLFEMIGWDILEAIRNGKKVCLSVFEGNKKYGDELLKLLGVSSTDLKFNFFSKDFFNGHTTEWSEKINEYLSRYVYTAHFRMESCEEISTKRFGEIPVVRNSYSCDRDRRIANNRMIDQLLNTNRVDHYVRHTPVWEPLYRKEEIHEMQEGVCLVQTETFEGYIDMR